MNCTGLFFVQMSLDCCQSFGSGPFVEKQESCQVLSWQGWS